MFLTVMPTVTIEILMIPEITICLLFFLFKIEYYIREPFKYGIIVQIRRYTRSHVRLIIRRYSVLDVNQQRKQSRPLAGWVTLWLNQTVLDRDWELGGNQSNATVWVMVQVQLKLQCENFNVLLWKPILSQSCSS